MSPPYDSQLSRPDPQGERVQVLARVTHTYTQPGKKGADPEGSPGLRRALSPRVGEGERMGKEDRRMMGERYCLNYSSNEYRETA